MLRRPGNKEKDRRRKFRFPIHRELRFKLLEQETTVAAGMGETSDISSAGVAFAVDQEIKPGAFIELSISWPVLLDESCPMRLIVFGRVLRSQDGRAACSVEKYEFRTQAKAFRPVTSVRHDSMLQRWADGFRKDSLKAVSA